MPLARSAEAALDAPYDVTTDPPPADRKNSRPAAVPLAWSAGEALAAGETVATTHGERRHERYRSKKWLCDVDKDFDMMRMRTMAMNDGDDGDDDGAWLNCDTTIALRSEVRHHCGAVMGFSCKCFDLHCLQ